MATNELGLNTVDSERHNLKISLTIKNFLYYVCKPGEVLISPRMEWTQRSGVKWTLQVYPYGQSKEEKEDIAVFLKLLDKPAHTATVSATYEICLIGKDGCKPIIKGPFTQVEESLRLGYGCPCLITRSEIKKNRELYLPNGNLTIRCEGKEEFRNLQLPRTKKIERLPQGVAPNHYSELVKKMYLESICCDVVLKAGASEFKCHKAVLAATSNYFEAMFGHDMKENREHVVDFSRDLNGEELSTLLDYIYLGNVNLSTINAGSLQTLYRVSDMYEIGGLAKVCEFWLLEQLNPENAIELLNFSDQFGAKLLKKAAASVIANSSD